MAVAYRSSSTSGPTDSQTNPRVITKPAGTLTDEIVLVAIEFWSATNPAITVTPPALFTQIVNVGPLSGGGGFIWLKCFWKKIVAGEGASWSFPFTGGDGSPWNLGQAISISGADTSASPIDAVNTATTSTTAEPAPSITATDADFLAYFVSRAQAGSQTTPPTSHTEVQDANVLSTSYRILTAPGTFSPSGGVASLATVQYGAYIAVKPAAASGSTASLSAITPVVGAAITSDASSSGAVSGTTPVTTSAAIASANSSGALSAAAPISAAVIGATSSSAASVDAATPATSASLLANSSAPSVLQAGVPVTTSAISAQSAMMASIAATTPIVVAAFAANSEILGQLSATNPVSTAALVAEVDPGAGSILNSSTPAASASLLAASKNGLTIITVVPAVQVGFAASAKSVAALDANTPVVVGAFSDLGSVAGESDSKAFFQIF